MRVPVIALALAAPLGCAAPRACPEAPPPRAAPAPSASVAPPPAPSLVIQLRLDTRLPGVAVEVTARGDGTPLSTWSIAAPDADAFHLDEARDDRGPFTPSLARRGGGLVLTLDRPAEGGVHVRYTVAARSRPASQAITVDADPNRFLASGEALLLLPEAFEDRAVPASIRVDPAPDDEHLGAASSFGFGLAREVTARGRDLRFATFLAGPSVGHALFDTLEGRDEAVWLGYTSFDPRPIAADVAAFRTAARELFRERSAEPHTLIIATDARPVGAFLASRRASSVLVRVGVGEPWSAPVRIAVAAEVLHAWIGGRLWIGPDDPAHEAEAYWFSEGLTRGFARDLLFRFGLVTPVELLDELHGLAAVVATSPYRGEGNAALAAHVHAPGALSLVVARGALYAARVDALVRARSGGKRRLDDVLRALYERAREKRGPLPASAWIEAITAELGPAEGDVFAATTRDGRPPEIPEGAFGPCFRGEKRRYQAFDPGFDEEATRAASEKVIQGLRAAGPAERAGLRGGDVLVDARLTRGRGDLPATLTITRDGEAKTLRYLPAGARADGQGWARRKDVGDEACAR